MSNQRYTVRCIVTGNALAESKQKGTPSVKIALQTQDENPRTLYADLWLTDAAFDATVETLETVFGWGGMKLEELNEPVLVGIEVDAVCEIEEHEGREYEKVAFLNAPGAGGGVKKMDDAQVKAVTSRLDAMLSRTRASRAGAGAGAPGTRRPPVGPRRQTAPQGAGDFPGYAPPDEGGF